MNKTLNVATLAETLKMKMEADRQQVEELTKNELNELARNLRDTSAAELLTTQNAIKHQLRELETLIDKKQLNEAKKSVSQALKDLSSEVQELRTQAKSASVWGWIKPTIIALSIFIGIFLGSLGLMQYLSSQIQSQLSEIESNRAALTDMTAWGVKVYTDSKGARFLILPEEVTGESYTTESGLYVTKLLPK